jgi:hypothetical protein
MELLLQELRHLLGKHLGSGLSGIQCRRILHYKYLLVRLIPTRSIFLEYKANIDQLCWHTHLG